MQLIWPAFETIARGKDTLPDAVKTDLEAVDSSTGSRGVAAAMPARLACGRACDWQGADPTADGAIERILPQAPRTQKRSEIGQLRSQ